MYDLTTSRVHKIATILNRNDQIPDRLLEEGRENFLIDVTVEAFRSHPDQEVRNAARDSLEGSLFVTSIDDERYGKIFALLTEAIEGKHELWPPSKAIEDIHDALEFGGGETWEKIGKFIGPVQIEKILSVYNSTIALYLNNPREYKHFFEVKVIISLLGKVADSNVCGGSSGAAAARAALNSIIAGDPPGIEDSQRPPHVLEIINAARFAAEGIMGDQM